MISEEVVRRIREIELYTRRLVSGSLIGDTTSAYKGTGLEFDQIREYQMGDDIRFIDWNSTARTGKLLVKQYMEERNRTILVALDCSASTLYGSQQQLKYSTMATVAAILALVGEYGKDHVGLILFSDEIELYIPPSKGRTHTRMMLERLFSFTPTSKHTNISKVLDHLAQIRKKQALVFLISDFIDTGYEKKLSATANMYDLIAVKMRDDAEVALPSVGYLMMQDSERDELSLINLRSKNSRAINQLLAQQHEAVDTMFRRYGVETIDMKPQSCAVGQLVRLFRRRMRY